MVWTMLLAVMGGTEARLPLFPSCHSCRAALRRGCAQWEVAHTRGKLAGFVPRRTARGQDRKGPCPCETPLMRTAYNSWSETIH
ncbi:hypothetical protein BJ546DRAFT_976468 [Cryomyces antarcticus]